MIDITVYCAVLHSPLDIVLIGTYDNEWEARNALADAEKKCIKENPAMTSSDFYHDWFRLALGDNVNYKITDYESVRDRYDNSAYGEDDGDEYKDEDEEE